MSPVTDPKILDRIKKCLSLATSAEPHEAARALEMAQALMAKHGISAEALESQEKEGVTEQTLRSVASASRVKDWELRLYDGIARAFGCALLFQRGMRPNVVKARGLPDHMRYGRYHFVGLEAEAKMAHYAAVVLQRQLQRARSVFTTSLPAYYDRAQKTRETDAYCNGWVLGAVSKLRPLFDAKMQAAHAQDAERGPVAGRSTALLVQSAEEKKVLAIREHMNRVIDPEFDVKMNTRDGGSSGAFSTGYRHGQEAEVDRPLTAGAPQGPALNGKK